MIFPIPSKDLRPPPLASLLAAWPLRVSGKLEQPSSSRVTPFLRMAITTTGQIVRSRTGHIEIHIQTLPHRYQERRCWTSKFVSVTDLMYWRICSWVFFPLFQDGPIQVATAVQLDTGLQFPISCTYVHRTNIDICFSLIHTSPEMPYYIGNTCNYRLDALYPIFAITNWPLEC
jgi:hypothetical protein